MRANLQAALLATFIHNKIESGLCSSNFNHRYCVTEFFPVTMKREAGATLSYPRASKSRCAGARGQTRPRAKDNGKGLRLPAFRPEWLIKAGHLIRSKPVVSQIKQLLMNCDYVKLKLQFSIGIFAFLRLKSCQPFLRITHGENFVNLIENVLTLYLCLFRGLCLNIQAYCKQFEYKTNIVFWTSCR